MPVYKLDLIMQAGGKGWRETYYRNFSGGFGTVLTVANTLAQKRALLNGQPVLIEAYSISDPLTPGRQGQSVYFNPPYQGAPDAVTGIGGIAGGAAGPSVSINVEFLNEAANASRRIQLRGVWDDAITHFNQLESTAYAGWYSQFLAWRSYLLQQQFGWMRRAPLKESFVAYSFAVNQQFPTFTFDDPAFFDAAEEGKYLSLRFSKFNGGKSVLNREIVVQVTGPAEAQAARPIAAGPMITEGKAIKYSAPAFVGADNIGVSRVGRRATGRPLLRTPGRSGARART